jgi:hypothetical protein
MKLQLLFFAMDLLTLLAYPFIYLRNVLGSLLKVSIPLAEPSPGPAFGGPRFVRSTD